MISEDNKGKLSVVRKMLLFLFIIAFFVCIIFIYYQIIYSSTRENIVNNGRINAIESADEVDMYMMSSVDILKLVSYTLDNMLREGRSQEEIFDYLTNETNAVRDSLIAETTGVYGYINGEYMDGSGWIPEEGYDPTIRPWYVEAKAGNGRFVIVDPYIDLDTGTVMIAIVKTLCDNESVVGIDLSVEPLQKITEERVADKRSYAECIVNGKGKIIAHSDTSLIGTELNDSANPFNATIAENMRSADDNYFYLEYEDRDYMVYVMPLDNEWTSISVIDASDDFDKLRIPLYITIGTAVILVSVLGFFMIRSDIKDREAKKLAVRSEIATAASEAKSSFLSNMSHEIRTPINAILGMNEMVIRESEDETILSYSENIKTAGSTLLGIVNDILDFSKIEAGKIEIIPVDYDVSEAVNDLVNMIVNRAENKGLTLSVEVDPGIPRRLYGDEVRLKQIITNILTNAVKYTEKGGITFRMGFEPVDGEPDYIMLNVSVQDTGIGIREDDIDKLFLEFERIEEKRNRNIEGTGLGMSITRSLLGLMGSELEVKSVYGEGSTFGFSIRQKITDKEPIGDYKVSFRRRKSDRRQYREKFTAPKASVLMVDDNEMNLMVFRSLVKQTMLKVDTAESGDEGIAMTEKKKYDIIFLDHMMPGKDGIETLHEIMGQPDNPNLNTPKICLTANAISGAREKYISEGFDDYLTKPIDSAVLEDMLIEYLPDKKVILNEMKAVLENTGRHTVKEKADNTGEILEKLSCLKDSRLIDIDKGIENSGAADTYLPVLKVFYETIDAKTEEIGRYYNDDDIKDYTIKVHALKSSARIIGAVQLGEDAQKLEDAGKSGDLDYIGIHHVDFMQKCMELKELLAGVFEAPDTGAADRPVADEELMNITYDEIREAAENMDCTSLEAIFSEMSDFRIPPEEEELYNSLRTASDNFEYDRITELLEQRYVNKV